MIKCITDTETTGLDPEIHTVHQLSCIVLDDKDVEIDLIDLKFRPAKLDYEQAALEKSHITMEELYSRELSSDDAFKIYTKFLDKYADRFNPKDKMQFVAYNSVFDEDFVSKWFDNTPMDYMYGSYFWRPSLCLYRVAAWILRDARVTSAFTLKSLCEFAGIEFNEDDAHDAMYDARKTAELYLKLV